MNGPLFSDSPCPACGERRIKVTPSGRAYCVPCRHRHEKRRKGKGLAASSVDDKAGEGR